jgi:predicted nucleic acid-binding protein
MGYSSSLGASHGFKTADAAHLATAIEDRADVFLTGDAGLTKCPGIRVELIS